LDRQLPQNRDVTGRFIAGQSGNPGGRPGGFRSHIKDSTDEGSELIEFVLSVFRGEHGEDTRQRTWLADRGFGKSTVNAGSQAPGFGDFTITIGDHDIMSNPINPNSLPPEPSPQMFSIAGADFIA